MLQRLSPLLMCIRAQVKQKVVVDVVLTLVVEEHIVRGLQDIFSPMVVSRMTDDQMKDLASETTYTKSERKHYDELLKKLRDGQKALQTVLGGTKRSFSEMED